MTEILNTSLFLFLFLQLVGFYLEVLVVNLANITHVLNFFFSSLTLFFLFFTNGSFSLELYQLTFLHLFSHFLNVFLLDLFMLFTNSPLEIFKFLFLLFFFSSFFFLFFFDLFLKSDKNYQCFFEIILLTLFLNFL